MVATVGSLCRFHPTEQLRGRTFIESVSLRSVFHMIADWMTLPKVLSSNPSGILPVQMLYFCGSKGMPSQLGVEMQDDRQPIAVINVV